uniref:Nsp1_C domain-containing protein n=1 Tax=Angiostrongylus cantonensis TaxID=6313 RepID=A0A158P768_ANGCA
MSNPVEGSVRSTTEATSTEASTGTSLKGLLEKEGSVVSACSQLLAMMTADTEISFSDLSAITDVDAKLATLEEKQSKMMYNISCISEEQKALDAAVSEMEKSLGLPDWTDQNSDLAMDAFSATPSDLKRQQLCVSALHKFKTAMSNANKATEDQVAQILKNQMETLLYIDRKTGELDAKVEEFKEILDGRNTVTL